MTIILVDDEPDALDMLEIEIQKAFPDYEIIGKFSDSTAAIPAINDRQPDILFLDIQMPVNNGFDVVKKINAPHTEIIFLTAYAEFAIEAIKVKAIDYLLKPIDSEEVVAAVKAVVDKRADKVNEQLEFVMSKLHSEQNPVLKIPTQDGVTFFKVKDIIYCKSESNYTTIVSTKRKLIIAKTLKSVEALLADKRFVRSHQSYLVNTDHIVEYVKKDGGYLLLTNDHRASLTRDKKELFID